MLEVQGCGGMSCQMSRDEWSSYLFIYFFLRYGDGVIEGK